MNLLLFQFIQITQLHKQNMLFFSINFFNGRFCRLVDLQRQLPWGPIEINLLLWIMTKSWIIGVKCVEIGVVICVWIRRVIRCIRRNDLIVLLHLSTGNVVAIIYVVVILACWVLLRYFLHAPLPFLFMTLNFVIVSSHLLLLLHHSKFYLSSMLSY